ncbi:MAG TPA: FtsL-like putative cell division protein [Bacteroidales bacterium]|nr:FtsL-like putative cell division protein [Bacteroidales bacterium]HQB20039.1 FtsL-like putative cell division protein [Bacteroidales bacterium]
MANKMDPLYQSEQQEDVQEIRQERRPVKEKVHKKPAASPFLKGLRLFFSGFLGGGFLKLINFRKNWLFILTIIIMLILIIYNSLYIQSCRNKIEKLKDEKIKITTEYMKIKQNTTYLDELQGQQLMEKFQESGYVKNKSLEYKIVVTKEEENE